MSLPHIKANSKAMKKKIFFESLNTILDELNK